MFSLPDEDAVTQGPTVDPARLARVRALFEAALEQPPAMRAAFLAGACGPDPALLLEVQTMLAADEDADAWLVGPLALAPASTSTPEEGRFPAGTVLASRYRVLGLLGHGGMGEVYRAHDLILNQPVALKFLHPTHLGDAALARFRNEVRIARQVSHHNVCRVYDVGMVEGFHFLSMEYIDGEDLASLIRRIGRLPQDKAIELTRKICAGLGAAHERGVLHRDLKPANIMIDGRGQPRITDFGLAGLTAEIPLSDLRSGTPAYMSPEQKAGREVTTRSDIYALGLVLHEMFTGKRRNDTQSNPSDIVKDLDPTIERLILRCLDEDPRRRPASAFTVAMALPGADPVAAALAAGETPSPEMVAASQEKDGLTKAQALVAFVTVVALALAAAWTVPRFELRSHIGLATPPDAMAYRAREILNHVGYSDPAVAIDYAYNCCLDENFAFIQTKYSGTRREEVLTSSRPPVVQFWYRQHQAPFRVVPSFLTTQGRVTYDEPDNAEPGMIRLALDDKGRLIALDVRPWQETPLTTAPSQGFDWQRLLSNGGFDAATLMPVDPRSIPPMAFDQRAAWEGRYGPDRLETFRIEAAAWAGRPVYFLLSFPGTIAEPPARPIDTDTARGILAVLTFFGACLVGWHNVRTGRLDRRGARSIAVVSFAAIIARWLLSASHAPTSWEVGALAQAIAASGFMAFMLCVAYVAIEPYVRRHWPDALISWTRLQAGHFQDSLVASHVLAGIAVVMSVIRVQQLCTILWDDWLVARSNDLFLGSPGDFASMLLERAIERPLSTGMVLVLQIVVLRLLLRRMWLADLTTLAMWMAVNAKGGLIAILVAGTFPLPGLWLLRRYGLLALFAGLAAYYVTMVPFSLTSWYATRTIVANAIPVAVAAWALRVVLLQRRSIAAEPQSST